MTENTDKVRTAIVVNDISSVSLETVQRALPANYKAYVNDDDKIVIAGHDVAGWTMDDYVIPRLLSFPIVAVETDADLTFLCTICGTIHDGPLMDHAYQPPPGVQS